MAHGKWFHTLTAATPVQAAARAVLQSRIGAVQYFVQLVASSPKSDPEDVHQLRVATRRLVAALSVFRPWLDADARRRSRRAARRLRQAAGTVRDLDVQRALFQEWLAQAGHRRSIVARRLFAQLDQQSRAARQELACVLTKWSKRFSKAAADLLESIAPPATNGLPRTNSLGVVAGHMLRDRLRQFRDAGRADLQEFDNLHQLRIAAKRLRYAMEVFAACYPPEFRRRLYGEVETIQTELGHVNDLRNLRETLAELCPAIAHRSTGNARRLGEPLVERLDAELAHDLVQRQRKFIDRWPRLQRDFLHGLRRLLSRRPAAAADRPARRWPRRSVARAS